MSTAGTAEKNATALAYTLSAGAPDVHTAHILEDSRHIGLEISAGKLYQLLACGAVSAADFRCLDAASKNQVWTLCLHACAQRLGGGAKPASQRRRKQ